MPTIAADRPDHPRPDRRRRGWASLNGPWAFGFDDADVGLARGWSDRPDAFDRTIVVPFVPQCAASGVGDVGRHEILWYRRVFENPAGPGERLLLHFGAVDHEATVWVNGVEVGRHRGGYTPFRFDVTEFCVPGENALVLRAVDRFRPDQVRGKQAPTFPYLISYTAASGIWQSVWLEVTGPSYLGDLDLRSDAATGRLAVTTAVCGEASGAMLELRVSREGRAVAAAAGPAGALVTLDVPDASLWSPAAPTLYDVELVLRAPDGEALDHLHGYTGFRSIEIRDGRWLLNGEPVVQRLLLDQGYWPDSNLTPPSDAAIRADLEYVKAAGFTGVRKHQKIEDPRWLWWADRLGVLVWAEMVLWKKTSGASGPTSCDAIGCTRPSSAGCPSMNRGVCSACTATRGGSDSWRTSSPTRAVSIPPGPCATTAVGGTSTPTSSTGTTTPRIRPGSTRPGPASPPVATSVRRRRPTPRS
jgi:beta-galactosidase/beta-glucuronidase